MAQYDLEDRVSELEQALELALYALNTAPRFLTPSAPEGLQDSYRICSHIEQLLKQVKREDAA